MKKSRRILFYTVSASLLAVLVLAGCARGQAADVQEKTKKDTSGGLQAVTCGIQTGNWEEGCPKQYVLDSKEEFARFDEEHFYISQMGDFGQKIGEADEDFFGEYILLCALITTGSGSDRFSVTRVGIGENGELEMEVSKEKAKMGTNDMAEWFLFARIERRALETVPGQFALKILS